MVTKRLVLRELAGLVVAAASPCLAEPLTSPSQLSPGNALIGFGSNAVGAAGIVLTVQ